MKATSVTCVQCGKTTDITGRRGPAPKYCSPRCRNRRNHERTRQDSRYDEALATSRQATKQRRLAQARPCPRCAAPMLNPRQKNHCGAPECKRAFQRDRMREWFRTHKEATGERYASRYPSTKATHTITCEQCGREATVTKKAARYCSHECFYDARYGDHRPRTPSGAEVKRQAKLDKVRARVEQAGNGVKGKGIWTVGRCSSCGQTFTRHSFGKPTTHCSQQCRHRERTTLRRALQYDLRAGRVSRVAIYERDGWTCHICGDPVDRSAPFPDLAAPVLDHVVPLARGGTHDEGNLKTAHFYCNSVKRDLEDGWSAAA